MKPGLSLRVSHHLALTPQLQQSIRLLQLSTLELASEVEQMLDENPFLERDEEQLPADEIGLLRADTKAILGDQISEAASDSAWDASDVVTEPAMTTSPENWEGDGSVDWASMDDDWSDGVVCGSNAADASDEDSAHTDRSRPVSLTEHLHQQALALRLNAYDMAALRFLIESLNDDGYLEDPLAQLAATLTEDNDELEQLEQLVHRFTVALKLLQSMDPPGVGARSMAECLMLQLRAQLQAPPLSAAHQQALTTAMRLCELPNIMELLAKRDSKKLAQLLQMTESQVQAAIQLISKLEPTPGRPFADIQHQVVVPDVIVSAVGIAPAVKFCVRLNPDVMPRLHVHEVYARALRGAKSNESHQALVTRLQEARWFIKNIQQRFNTILRVSKAIVERQHNFFIHGELAMRPMVQRDLADELGLHESTISRVTTAKYMATPKGTFELKYFFGSALGTDAGGNASSTAVRALIKQLVAAEDPARPLSDSKIADLLKEQGIDCARRTVAKYRESLRIPIASLRRAARA